MAKSKNGYQIKVPVYVSEEILEPGAFGAGDGDSGSGDEKVEMDRRLRPADQPCAGYGSSYSHHQLAQLRRCRL